MNESTPPPGTILAAPDDGSAERRLRAFFIARGVIVPGDPDVLRPCALSARFLPIDDTGRRAALAPVAFDFFERDHGGRSTRHRGRRRDRWAA